MLKQAAGADDRVASVGAEGSGAGIPPPRCADPVPLLPPEITRRRVLLAGVAGPQRVRKAKRTTTIT